MKYIVIAAVCIGSALARPDGAGGHHAHGHGHSAAAAAPAATGYEQPQASYGEPASGYEQPSGYSAPSGYESGYGAATGYGTGYGEVEESGGVDLNMILIPILIIAGLALLFPSVTTVAVSSPRSLKKRDADDETSGNSLVERVQDIYMSVLESEECMERVACEVGGIVADAGISKKMFSMAEPFVPLKYSKVMKNFNNAKDCHQIKCGSLF